MDCLCFSALLIKYLLLGNALPVRPRWLVIIPSPWLWNLSCRSNAANCCSLPRQIFHQLPGLVEGDIVPLGCRPLGPVWLRWVCCQPWGSHGSFCLEKTLCLHQCSDSQPGNPVKGVETGRGPISYWCELEQWHLIKRKTHKQKQPTWLLQLHWQLSMWALVKCNQSPCRLDLPLFPDQDKQISKQV